MRISTFWTRWLLLTFILLIGFGLILIFVPSVFQNTIGRLSYNQLFNGEEAFAALSDENATYLEFNLQVMGAIIVGWFIPLVGIIVQPFRQGETWAWNVITLSVVAWFILDTGASLASGITPNALGNLGFFIPIIIPLLATYHQFHPR